VDLFQILGVCEPKMGMKKAMATKSKTETQAYGIRTLRSRHQEIRRLKRLHQPSVYGFRVWASSWLLINFLKNRTLRYGTRMLELGCGWGLPSIYCAKEHNARVTGVDIDSEVFPFLHKHAAINGVEIATLQKGFDELVSEDLLNFDVMMGADICFWDTITDSLARLISQALSKDVRFVIIADPGRPSFERLVEHFLKEGVGDVHNYASKHPFVAQGRILKIGSLG
jgi:predicted nicotinamide N-methyase